MSSPIELPCLVRERIQGRFHPPKNFNSVFCTATFNSLDGFIIEKITDWSVIYSLSKFKKMMPCTVRKGEVETEFSSRQRKRSSSIFEQTGNFWCRIFSNRFRLSCVQRQDLSITLLASIAILVMTNRKKIFANLSTYSEVPNKRAYSLSPIPTRLRHVIYAVCTIMVIRVIPA